MKKYKLKNKYKFILIFVCICIILLFCIVFKYSQSNTYSVDYSIGDFKIRENYVEENQSYYIEITYNETTYSFIDMRKPLKTKKVIEDIEIKENKEYICLEVKSELKTNPLCSNEKENIDYHLTNMYEQEEQTEENINNYKIFNNDNLLIWNYKGIDHIGDKQIQNIPIFTKDVYDTSLITQVNDYILVPDYNQKYNFDIMYIINSKDNSIKKWKLKYKISFDSYSIGSFGKSIFIVDKNKKIEYELVPHKQKMRIVGSSKRKGIIYINGEAQTMSINKFIQEQPQITYKTNYHYFLENNTIYLSFLDSKIKTKITNNKIDKIIAINADTIYYISKNILYKYNINNGEEKVLEYNELEFNSENVIFINNEK